jgi:hypothetical protein
VARMQLVGVTGALRCWLDHMGTPDS